MIKEIHYAEFIEEVPSSRAAIASREPLVSHRVMIDSSGREVLDNTPVSIPVPVMPAPSSMLELVHQLYREMHNQEYETFADAEDFDVPDELGIEMRNTPYEQDFDHIESVAQPAGAPEKSPTVDNGGSELVQE